MKKAVLLFSVIILLTNVYGQNQAYYENMGKNLQKFGTAQTIADWQTLANQFDRIANVETTEWLPLYYAAQSTIFMSFQEQDKSKVDAYLDQAQKFVDKSLLVKQDESEIYVLQGLLYQARIGVDPMGRGQKYSMMASESFEKAKELNAENPRIYYLEGMSVMNTPEMFGGGKKNALPLLQLANEKFEKFAPASQLSPNWGKEHNLEQLSICSK